MNRNLNTFSEFNEQDNEISSGKLYAKKSLGQNFLRSTKALRQIVEAANLSSKDIVLEVGPGEGVLTIELLKQARTVVAVEKDDRLIPILQEKFAVEISDQKLILIHGDILEISLPSILTNRGYKLVANIPYYITGLLLPFFLSGNLQPSRAVVLVQKEVADRIVAHDKKESILSMSVKAYGVPRIVDKVPRGAFVPAPNVDSAILEISNISKDFFSKTPVISEKSFFETLKKGFAHKRKLLRGNLEISEEQIQSVGLPPKVRAEDITLEDWKKLTQIFS